MTKTEILAALTARKKRGFIRGRPQKDNWASGFQAAEDLVRRCLAASVDADPEPVAVVFAPDQPGAKKLYDPNLSSAEVCGPFNPSRAIYANRPGKRTA